MHSTKKSQLAAMQYLADKNPKKYVFNRQNDFLTGGTEFIKYVLLELYKDDGCICTHKEHRVDLVLHNPDFFKED